MLLGQNWYKIGATHAATPGERSCNVLSINRRHDYRAPLQKHQSNNFKCILGICPLIHPNYFSVMIFVSVTELTLTLTPTLTLTVNRPKHNSGELGLTDKHRISIDLMLWVLLVIF